MYLGFREDRRGGSRGGYGGERGGDRGYGGDRGGDRGGFEERRRERKNSDRHHGEDFKEANPGILIISRHKSSTLIIRHKPRYIDHKQT